MNTKIHISLLAVILFCSLSYAKNKSLHDQIVNQNYGTAGCGLGSVVFADEPGLVQIFAVTLNNFMGNQTFGISSGTLNCVEKNESSSTSVKERLDYYVLGNQNHLQNDIARGSGDSLVAIAKIANCKKTNLLNRSLKKQFASIFHGPNSNYRTVSQKIYNIMDKSDCKI